MSFDKAIEKVLGFEGGYVDDSYDPGGKTRFGITEAVARENGYTGPMQALPLDTAKQIYRESYWNAVRGEELPWPLSFFVFDMAVNSGPQAAIRTLQHALRLSVDGVLGPVTLEAAKHMNQDRLALFLAERAVFYTELAQFGRYGRGWLKRLFLQAKELP